MVKRIAFTVHGRVQGVFFRKFTCSKATSLEITGWVQNNSDGTVSGEAQGQEEPVKRFVEHLHDGPRAAQVERVEQRDIDVKEGERGFSQ